MPIQPHRTRPTRRRFARFSPGRPAAIAACCIAFALFATACGGSTPLESVSATPVTAEAAAAEAAAPVTETTDATEQVAVEAAEPEVESPAPDPIASGAGGGRLLPEYFQELVDDAGQARAECIESGLSDAAITVFNSNDEAVATEANIDMAREELTVVASECGAALRGLDDPTSNPNYQLGADGDMTACDDLYLDSPIGSQAEDFGYTCGNRLTMEEALEFDDSCELL